MPPVPQTPDALRPRFSTLWFAIVGLVILAGGIFAGVQIAKGNVDYVCNQTVNNSGACTGGSWSPWVTNSQTGGIISESRTYTGTRYSLQGSFQYIATADSHQTCGSLLASAQGTITSQLSACQIVENRTRDIGTGAAENPNAGTVTSSSSTETMGSVSSSTAVSGTYAQYQDMVNEQLATSSLQAIPSLVHNGDTTKISWSSDRMRSCTVTATNGDTWDALASPTGGQVSSAITQQTTYTLTCLTALGTPHVSTAVVNILPTFQEL